MEELIIVCNQFRRISLELVLFPEVSGFVRANFNIIVTQFTLNHVDIFNRFVCCDGAMRSRQNCIVLFYHNVIWLGILEHCLHLCLDNTLHRLSDHFGKVQSQVSCILIMVGAYTVCGSDTSRAP